MTFFLITTDHLETRLWFLDDDDFKTGMNYVATVAFLLGVQVIAFILMSNHVHFVLECTREQAVRFITEFKRRYSKYYQHKYGVREFLRGNGVDIKPLSIEDESVKRAIAYVQMNSVAAGICANASYYPWGSGNCFFRVDQPAGTFLKDLSRRKQIRLLHSFDRPKETFRLTGGDYIDPISFVSIRFVEQLFVSPSRYNYFLQSSSKARLRLQESALPSFRDQNILAGVQDLCHSLFRKHTLKELSPEETGELMRQLRFRFSADPAQLARVLELPYDQVVRLLDSM